jgi:sigma-E factor negative regulatory protein RseC
MMEQLVRVCHTNDDGTAQVIHIRESACSGDCHKCSGCGAVQQKLIFTASNPIGAKPGELVTVKTRSAPVLAAAAMLYVLPILLFFAGYLIGYLAWDQGALAGGIGFAVGLVAAAVYDRCVARKKDTTYTITGYADRSFLA